MKIIMDREKVGELTLLVQKSHSTIYKEILDGKTYCLKKYDGWENLSISDVLDSYTMYDQLNLQNVEGIVKIYSVSAERNSAYIRMEFLEDYISLRDWLIFNKDKKQRDLVLTKIFNILSSIMARGGLYTDCGDGNWMINKDLDVKLIDLDVLLRGRVTELHYLGLGFLDLLQKFYIAEEIKQEPLIIEKEKIITDSLPYRKEILKKTPLYRGGDLLLDCGCAEGNFIGDFAPIYKKVIAFDPNPKSIELAKKQTLDFKNVEVYNKSFKDFEPKEIHPNVVWMGNSFHYIFMEYRGFSFYQKLLEMVSDYLIIEYPPDINAKGNDMEQLKASFTTLKIAQLYTRENILKLFAKDFELRNVLKSFTHTREILVLKKVN